MSGEIKMTRRPRGFIGLPGGGGSLSQVNYKSWDSCSVAGGGGGLSWVPSSLRNSLLLRLNMMHHGHHPQPHTGPFHERPQAARWPIVLQTSWPWPLPLADMTSLRSPRRGGKGAPLLRVSSKLTYLAKISPGADHQQRYKDSPQPLLPPYFKPGLEIGLEMAFEAK